MTKQELRQHMREISRTRSAETGEEIWERVESLDEFAGAHTILIFMSLPDEVPTAGFIRKWNGRKRFVIPKVAGEDLILKEYDPRFLEEGYQGILEPGDGAMTADPSEIELALVPGVAFDRMGHRMGRGKGFYDRLLPSLHCPAVAICQSWRIVDEVPVEPWDRKMDIVP